MAIQAIDFRKGIDGIAALCRECFSIDPLCGHYFIFRNRRGSAVKVLAYDVQGFFLYHKRLSKGTFRHWPQSPTSAVMLSATQLQVLLQNGNPAAVESIPPWHCIDE